MALATETRQGQIFPEAMFQRVTVVQTGRTPDLQLLEFAALLSSWNGGGAMTVAAFPSDEVLRELPAAVGRFSRSLACLTPEIRLVTEPELEAVFPLAEELQADLLVMRRPRRVSARALACFAGSICLAPPDIPREITRILVHVGLDAGGQYLLRRAGRLGRAVGAGELLALHIGYPETTSPGAPPAEERWRELVHFVRRSSPPGITCTPLLEESARPVRTLARVADQQAADLVLIGRQPGERGCGGLRELAAECLVPVMQITLPKPKNGLRGRLRQVFSQPEPAFN